MAGCLFPASHRHSHRAHSGLCATTVGPLCAITGISLLTLLRFVKTSPPSSIKAANAVAISILLSPALLIVDHIHFQYNGFLYGILVLSLVTARKPSTILFSGILFAALLCLKHIYLYLAPAYFVFLLRAYCFSPESISRLQARNCIQLGLGLLLVFGAAFGPFVYWGQLDQVLARLFPFSRGLCHAYWAPNVWAMYSFSDRVLIYGEFNGSSHFSIEAYSTSCTSIRAISGSVCSQQCHSRSSGRFLVRCFTQRLA